MAMHTSSTSCSKFRPNYVEPQYEPLNTKQLVAHQNDAHRAGYVWEPVAFSGFFPSEGLSSVFLASADSKAASNASSLLSRFVRLASRAVAACSPLYRRMILWLASWFREEGIFGEGRQICVIRGA